MWFIILALILIGLALIVIELVFIPGTTFVGLVGAIFTVAGVAISYNHFGSQVGLYILIATSIITLVTLIYSFRSGAWSRFSLKTSIDSKVNEGALASLSVGDQGLAISTLRPFGKAEFANRTYEVKSAGDYIENGTYVKIIQIQSHQIIVEPTNKS